MADESVISLYRTLFQIDSFFEYNCYLCKYRNTNVCTKCNTVMFKSDGSTEVKPSIVKGET